jgi:hypothetical protein
VTKFIRVALIAATLLSPLLSKAAEGDWGYAHINFIKKTLNEDWAILSRSQVTLSDDFDEFYFWFIDAGLAYSITPAWRIEGAYRHAVWKISDEWEEEQRPMINLDWFGKVKDTKLSNRARLEYRYYTWDKQNDFRFRNRTRAEFPWEVLPGGIKPFIEEELFIGKNSGKLEMNWVTGGLYWKGSKPFKLRAGYRWFAIRVNNEWENRNQLVTSLSLYF